LVADDLQDLLRGREAAKHILPHRAVADTVDERFDDLEIDVGFEQRETNFAERGLDVRFRQPRLAAKRLEHVLEAFAEGLEHISVLAGPHLFSRRWGPTPRAVGSRLSLACARGSASPRCLPAGHPNAAAASGSHARLPRVGPASGPRRLAQAAGARYPTLQQTLMVTEGLGP